MEINPCEPLLFGHVFVKEQLTSACQHQMNEFTLSRPRDFISAFTKERDSSVSCRSGDNSQSSTTTGEIPSTLLRGQLPCQAQANSHSPGHTSTERTVASATSRYHSSAQLEDQSSSLRCSAANSPPTSTMPLDCRVTEFTELCSASSPRRGEALNQNQKVYTEKREG